MFILLRYLMNQIHHKFSELYDQSLTFSSYVPKSLRKHNSYIYAAYQEKIDQKLNKGLKQNFLHYHFLIEMITDFLPIEDVVVFASILDIYPLLINWKKLALRAKLLSVKSKNNGIEECIYYTQITKQSEYMYMSAAIQSFGLKKSEMIGFLKQQRNPIYHSRCHVVNRQQAFSIASLKYDGFMNMKKAIYEKNNKKRKIDTFL